jgi:hypothetical protein
MKCRPPKSAVGFNFGSYSATAQTQTLPAMPRDENVDNQTIDNYDDNNEHHLDDFFSDVKFCYGAK